MAQTTRDEKAGKNVAELGKRTADRTADATLEAAKRAEDTAGRGLQAAQGTADATLEAAERAGENVAELGRRTAGKAADATPEAAEKAEDTAGRGLQAAQRTAGAAVEVERAVARRSAEGAADLGQAFAELLDAQTRHGVEAFRALTRTVDWNEAARIQGEFLRVSLERTAEFNRRYFEVVQAVISSAAATAKDQARRAA